MLRVTEYRARQRRKRANDLKVTLMAVMVCVLVILSQWGAISEEDWYRPTDSPEIVDGTYASDEIVGEESATVALGDTEVNTEVNTENIESPSGVTIEKLGLDFVEEGESEIAGRYTEYENPDLADCLARYLAGLREVASEKSDAEASATEENKMDEAVSEELQADSSGQKGMYKFTIQYSGGTEVSYIVIEGDGELRVRADGCLILDHESWEQLMQIMRE